MCGGTAQHQVAPRAMGIPLLFLGVREPSDPWGLFTEAVKIPIKPKLCAHWAPDVSAGVLSAEAGSQLRGWAATCNSHPLGPGG